jgi:hypothetical protein
MRNLMRGRFTSAHAIALLALFVVLGGSAVAAQQASVGTKSIKANAITTKKIKNGAITTNKIKNGAVTTPKIANVAVTNSQLADNAVTTSKLADGAVANSKLAENAVTSGKITNAAITNSKLADNAVTNSKLAENAVTTAKISNGGVRAPDLGPIVTVQNTVQIAAGAEGTADVACPAGSIMLSGGGYWTTGANNLRTTLKQANGWRVEGKNTLAVSAPLTVQAYCLTE